MPQDTLLGWSQVKKGIIYTDGASSGNPGDSGIGVVIKTENEKIELSEYIGIATNNMAEYTALLKGLSKAKKLGLERVDVLLDSELLVKQIRGEYSVKSESLKGLYNKVMSLLKTFKAYSIKHVPREKNAEADKLAKKAVKKSRAALQYSPINER